VSVMALALMCPGVAQASSLVSPSPSGVAEAAIPEGSVLATPAEVAEMGGGSAAVAHQTAVWAALPEATRSEQREINAEEHERARAAFDNIVAVPLPASPLTRRYASPLIFRDTCFGQYSGDDYKVASDDGQTTQCFAGAAGTYTLTSTFKDWGNTAGIKVQPAQYTGRVYYMLVTTYFWSTTRNKGDYSWYTFTISYDQYLEVLRVQLF
jgi:hypothetical protein